MSIQYYYVVIDVSIEVGQSGNLAIWVGRLCSAKLRQLVFYLGSRRWS